MQVAGRRSDPVPVEKVRSGMRTSAPSRSSSWEQSGKCACRTSRSEARKKSMYGKGASASFRPAETRPARRVRDMGLVNQAADIAEQGAVELVIGIADPLDRIGEAGKLVLGHDRERHADQRLVGGDRMAVGDLGLAKRGGRRRGGRGAIARTRAKSWSMVPANWLGTLVADLARVEGAVAHELRQGGANETRRRPRGGIARRTGTVAAARCR